MHPHLEQVRRSYDQAIELGRRGIDRYRDLPVDITSQPAFASWQQMTLDGDHGGDSGGIALREFLAPASGMKFVDLGCCLNLMFRGYDRWPSLYHGVDISPATIELLQEFVTRQGLVVGSLDCASIHDTPFAADCFDIGACIGVLEYYEREFVVQALREMYRILKPGAKLVLDIPRLGHPVCRIMQLVEAHLGRPDRFDLSATVFEDLLREFFTIHHKKTVAGGALIQYFLNKPSG